MAAHYHGTCLITDLCHEITWNPQGINYSMYHATKKQRHFVWRMKTCKFHQRIFPCSYKKNSRKTQKYMIATLNNVSKKSHYSVQSFECHVNKWVSMSGIPTALYSYSGRLPRTALPLLQQHCGLISVSFCAKSVFIMSFRCAAVHCWSDGVPIIVFKMVLSVHISTNASDLQTFLSVTVTSDHHQFTFSPLISASFTSVTSVWLCALSSSSMCS